MLNSQEIDLTYHIIRQCQSVMTINELNRVMNSSVKQLIGHQMAGYGIGEVIGRKILFHVNLGFPESYLAHMIDNDQVLSSRLARAWQENPVPQMVEEHNVDAAENLHEYNSAARNRAFVESDIRNLLSHGLCDIAGRRTSYFCFARITDLQGSKHRHLAETVIPHLHVALTHAMDNEGIQYGRFRLSDREIEILQLMSRSQSNVQIAYQLDITESTVKSHIRNIYSKLQVNDRIEAVLKAMIEGLL